MSVSAAVEKYVGDGDYLASGGFGGNRIATAILHEIVRQKKQNLGIALRIVGSQKFPGFALHHRGLELDPIHVIDRRVERTSSTDDGRGL